MRCRDAVPVPVPTDLEGEDDQADAAWRASFARLFLPARIGARSGRSVRTPHVHAAIEGACAHVHLSPGRVSAWSSARGRSGRAGGKARDAGARTGRARPSRPTAGTCGRRMPGGARPIRRRSRPVRSDSRAPALAHSRPRTRQPPRPQAARSVRAKDFDLHIERTFAPRQRPTAKAGGGSTGRPASRSPREPSHVDPEDRRRASPAPG